MTNHPFLFTARFGRNDTWRYIATVVLVGSLTILGTTCLGAIAIAIARSPVLTGLPDWVTLLLSLAPFGFVILGLWIGMRVLHQRPFSTLLRPLGEPFRWGLLGLSAGIWLALSAAGDGVLALFQPGNYHFVFEPSRFWPYALVAVLLLPVQVAAEELLFRGYLTQAFGLAGGFRLAWLVPSIAFGLLHSLNPEVLAYGPLLTLPIYIGIGLLLGWITLRTAGLESSLGLHLANNLYGTLLVTAPSSALPAPALFRIQQYHPLAALVVFMITVAVYLALFMAAKRG